MAYEIELTALLTVPDPEIYINDCCWGGDVIRDRLVAGIATGYDHMETLQEDWGWYIWMRRGEQWSGVDIYCDNKQSGEFRIHISGWQARWLGRKHIEGNDLEHIKDVTVNEIGKWGKVIKVRKFTADFKAEL